ncbi:lipase family protein [Helicobacter sp. T3_23-1059]
MDNGFVITKLRDYAELAQASYGYFHCIGHKIRDKELVIENQNVLGMNFNNLKVVDSLGLAIGKLNGDFTTTQAKHFFEKYDLLIHQPNTESGFSATLFQHKQSKLFTLAIRGTDEYWKDIKKANIDLIGSKVPLLQYNDMLLFHAQCKGEIPFYVDSESKPKDEKSLEYSLWKKIYNQSNDSKYRAYINQKLLKDSNKPTTQSNFIPPIVSSTKLTITGHSLGGALAQLFALSFATDKDSSIIKEIYTYNAPGARDLKPPFKYILEIPLLKNATEKEIFTQKETEKIHNVFREYFTRNVRIQIKEQLNKFVCLNNATNVAVALIVDNDDMKQTQDNVTMLFYPLNQCYVKPYQTLIHNYNNKNKEGYKLSISDRVFHIETKDQSSKKHHSKESYSDNATQHLGKDINGNYFILNLNFGGFDNHKIVE